MYLLMDAHAEASRQSGMAHVGFKRIDRQPVFLCIGVDVV